MSVLYILQGKGLPKSQKNLDFPERLRLLRKKRGFNQDDFAKKIGLTGHAQVSRYESGKSLPDVALLQKTAEVLQVDLHWLITGNPSPDVVRVVDQVKPYVLAHLSDITINLQKLERERRDLYARDAQGESLKGAIKDVELLIEKQHRYYERAFREMDEVLGVAAHRTKRGRPEKLIRRPKD